MDLEVFWTYHKKMLKVNMQSRCPIESRLDLVITKIKFGKSYGLKFIVLEDIFENRCLYKVLRSIALKIFKMTNFLIISEDLIKIDWLCPCFKQTNSIFTWYTFPYLKFEFDRQKGVIGNHLESIRITLEIRTLFGIQLETFVAQGELLDFD